MTTLRSRVALAGSLTIGLVLSAAPGVLAAPHVRAPGLRGQAQGSQSQLLAVSCAASGNCVAVGTTATGSGQTAVLDVERTGHWVAIPAPLPAGAATTNGTVVLDATACAAINDCVAVGSYTARSGGTLPLLDIERGGVWASVAVPLPQGAATTTAADVLAAASCPDIADCVVVGSYTTASGATAALLDVETAGTWAAVTVPLGPGAAAKPADALQAVTCTAVGTCVAVGDYVGSAGESALLDVDAAGTWSDVAVPLPANAAASSQHDFLDAVSCADATDCVAVGSYLAGGGLVGALIDEESTGTWADVSAPLPPNAQTPHNVLESVACPAVGDCVAVGDYVVGPNEFDPLVESESSGTWSAAAPALPADASSVEPFNVLASVSCWAVASCVAVGFYTGPDSYLYPKALLDVELSGAWAAGPDTLPANAAEHPDYSVLDAVSCTGFLSCTAVGDYADVTHASQGLLQQIGIGLAPTSLAPSPPTRVTVVAGHGLATVSWRAPADDGGSAVTRYVAIALPGGARCATTTTTCVVRPLTPGRSYAFRVVAATELGSSVSVTTPPVRALDVVDAAFTIGPFGEGSAALTPLLVAQVQTIARHVADGGDTSVTLSGYNDGVPGGAASVAISAKRARAVAAALSSALRRLGVRDVAIATVGRGDADPVATDATAAGRAKNRRVVARLR